MVADPFGRPTGVVAGVGFSTLVIASSILVATLLTDVLKASDKGYTDVVLI